MTQTGGSLNLAVWSDLNPAERSGSLASGSRVALSVVHFRCIVLGVVPGGPESQFRWAGKQVSRWS